MRASRARILAGLLLNTALRPALRAMLGGQPVRGARLLVANARFLLRDGLWPHEARLLRGDLPHIRAVRSRLYFQLEHQLALAPHAGALARMGLSDKAAFADFCREEGLAHIPTVRMDGALPESWERAFAATAAATASNRVFVKPARGSGGRGSALLERLGERAWRLTDAAGVHEGALSDVTRSHRSAGPLVMQPLLANHPALAAWAGPTLATFRTITAQEEGDAVAVLSMLAELPLGDERPLPRAWCIVPVDRHSGTLAAFDEAALAALPAGNRERAARFAGRVIPEADALAALAREAHRRISAASLGPLPPMIGWDVALAEAGPVLVEPNWNWSVAAHYRNLAGLDLGLSDQFAAAAARR